MHINPMFMFYDPLYMAVLVIISLLSFGVTSLLKHYVRRGDLVQLRTGLSGAEVATKLLRSQGITDVAVVKIGGVLTDNYNPRSKVLSLSMKDVPHQQLVSQHMRQGMPCSMPITTHR